LPESINAEYLGGKTKRRRDSVTKKELSQLYYLNHEIEQERIVNAAFGFQNAEELS